jgi:hypothetical protein
MKMDTQQILSDAHRTLDNILKFYQTNNVPLSYRPTVILLQEPVPEMAVAEAFAFVKGEGDVLAAINKRASASLHIEVCKKFFGIDLSEEAAQELFRIHEKFDPTNSNQRTGTTEWQDKTIYLLPGYQKIDEAARKWLFAHEVWYLIEQEKGVFKQHLSIAEGTATYAGWRYIKAKGVIEIEQCPDNLSLAYVGAGKLVQDYVGASPNPLTTTLDCQVRDLMEAEYLTRERPFLIRNAELFMQDEEKIKELGGG